MATFCPDDRSSQPSLMTRFNSAEGSEARPAVLLPTIATMIACCSYNGICSWNTSSPRSNASPSLSLRRFEEGALLALVLVGSLLFRCLEYAHVGTIGGLGAKSSRAPRHSHRYPRLSAPLLSTSVVADRRGWQPSGWEVVLRGGRRRP
jgi:hypothetical protein